MADERILRHELLDAARGQTPKTDEWKKSQGSENYFNGKGGQNIWLLRFATQALKRQEIPWREVYYHQLGIWESEWGNKPKDIQPAFGGSEFLSTIYWGWHIAAHLAMTRHPTPSIARYARRWCALNWAIFRAITAPDGSLLLFGQRSAGHNPIPRETDWWYALAIGDEGGIKRAEKWCKQAGCGLRQSWEYEYGMEFRKEMRETYKESVSIDFRELERDLPLRVPTEIVKTNNGIVVVHAANCNPNTPPILAGKWENGHLTVLPTSTIQNDKTGRTETIPGGIRLRQKFDHATAHIENGEIVYKSSLYTGGNEKRIKMPSGEVIYHLRLGRGERAINKPIDTSPVIEPEPVDDSSSINLPLAIDLLLSLQLSRKHKPIRDDIVSLLRAGNLSDQDLSAIADQVETFGIGNKQEQYTRWRQALSILRKER